MAGSIALAVAAGTGLWVVPAVAPKAALSLFTPSYGRCAFSPDGSLLAFSRNDTVGLRVLRTSDWTVVFSEDTIASNGIGGIEFSPDGTKLAVGYASSPRLRVYNTSNWSVVAGTPVLAGQASSVSWSPDGSRLAVGLWVSPWLVVINTSDWSVVSGFPNFGARVWNAIYSPDGARLAVTRESIAPRVLSIDAATFATVGSINSVIPGSNGAVSWSPDGSKMVVGLTTGGAMLNVYTRDCVLLHQGPTGSADVVAWSPDGQWIATSVNAAPRLRVFNASDYSRVPADQVQAFGGVISGMAFSPVPLLPVARGAVSAASGERVANATVRVREQHGAVVQSTHVTDAAGEYALATLKTGRYVLEISDPRPGADLALIEQPLLSLETDLELEHTLWPIGTPQAFGPGNVTTTAGLAADRVAVFLWADKRLVKTITPDAAGDWSADLAPGVYGLSYFAANCQPVTHGPYTISEA